MLELTRKGFLLHPYTSSGKIPTDKGYLLFVEELLEKVKPQKNLFKDFEILKEEIDDLLEFSQDLTSILNRFSSGVIINYLFDKGLLWEEGWQEVLLEPEFEDRKCIRRFTKLMEEIETRIHDLFSAEPFDQIKVFVGKENPILRCDDFGMIVSKLKIPKTKQGACLMILGPKRMPYKKNLVTLYTLCEFLETIL